MTAAPPRLHSLDFLRGFALLWVLGAAEVVQEAAKYTGRPGLEWLGGQLRHVPWAGFHLLDGVFPLFMFCAGVAIPYALDGKLARGELTRGGAMGMACRRAGVLVLLGWLYNGVFASDGPGRYAGVLGQIGLAYAAAVAVHLAQVPEAVKRALVVAVPVLVAAVHLLVPVPGGAAGVLTPDGSVNAWLDGWLLPGRLYFKHYDPEGVLCVVSATTLTLGGRAAGVWIRTAARERAGRAAGLALAGAAVLAAGWAANAGGYPLIKNIWTGSFCAVALGGSLLLFAAAHLVIDRDAEAPRWTLPLRVIGMNSLVLYLGVELVPVGTVARAACGRFAAWAGQAEGVVLAVASLALVWALSAWLYRRRLFLSV